MPENNQASTITIPARLEYLSATLCFIEEMARTMGFEKRELLHIRLAMEETLVDIINHGYPDDPNGTITITTKPGADSFRITVREKGIPYDPEMVLARGMDLDATDGLRSGMSMQLASYAMNEVHYHNLGRQGREVVLVEHLPSQHVAELLSLEAPKKEDENTPKIDPGTIQVRRLQAEDALSVSRCAYLTYGYAYEDFIYYPEKIRSMNDEGSLVSVVATTEDNTLMGHCAVKRLHPGDTLREMGVLIVAPEARSLGIANLLTEQLLKEAHSSGAHSVFVRAVAGHTVSQRLAEKHGLNSCAIMLGTFPKDVEFKQLTGVIKEKMSALALWRDLGNARSRKLYIPTHHKEWVTRIYDELNLLWEPVDITDSQIPQAVKNAHMAGHLVDILDIGEITIPDCSAPMIKDVHRTLRQLCLKGADVVYLYVNIEHPDAPAMIEALEAHDCFFAGIIPDRVAGCDAMVLQYLSNVQITYESIKLTEGLPMELLQYIKEMDPSVE